MNLMIQPGHFFKHYKVGEMLGIGAFGQVYQAEDMQNDKKIVAVKVQNLVTPSEAELYERLKSYKFYAVLNIYDFFQLDQNYVVVMELGNSANLRQYKIQHQCQLDQDQINEIFFQISFGVWELVKLNLIHRDIKPENIVVHLEEHGQQYFKICDLGLSKAQDKATTINVGTPNYMAPELYLQSTKSLNFSVDIWALGAIIFELYSNMPLFSGKEVSQVRAKVLGTSEFMIEQEVKKYVNNQKHSEILCKIFKKDPLARPNIEYILQQLDSNRFDNLQQHQLQNQTQQNEIMQTIQKLQSEYMEQEQQQEQEDIQRLESNIYPIQMDEVILNKSLKDQKLIIKVQELLNNNADEGKQFLINKLVERSMEQLTVDDFVALINETNN